jgi:uncharacterized protein
MSRPFKCRRVNFVPGVTYFKPAGIPLRILEEIQLTVEELEAIRLKDLESMEQEQGAEKMNISRQTFQRVLAAARQKVADALLNGKAIRIEGGNYEIVNRSFRCRSGHERELEASSEAFPMTCPMCNTPDINPTSPNDFNI